MRCGRAPGDVGCYKHSAEKMLLFMNPWNFTYSLWVFLSHCRYSNECIAFMVLIQVSNPYWLGKKSTAFFSLHKLFINVCDRLHAMQHPSEEREQGKHMPSCIMQELGLGLKCAWQLAFPDPILLETHFQMSSHRCLVFCTHSKPLFPR